MKTRFVVLCLLCVIASSPHLLAQPDAGRPGAFLRMGVGARALALGGTFVALADDPSAGYWNPAGLAQLNQIEVLASYYRMPSDRTHYFASGVLPWGRVTSIGVSWINLGVSGIEARAGNTAAPDYLFSNNASALLITAARQINSFFSVGVNAKLFSQSLDNASAFGTGMDLALFVHPTRFVKFGLTLQDLGSKLKWSTGWREAFPMTVRGGVSANLADNFLMSLEAVKIDNSGLEFCAGAEYKALEVFPIRLGYSGQGVVGGAGLAIPMRTLDLKLDYAYSDDLLEASRSNKLSLGLALTPRQRVRKSNDEALPLTSAAEMQSPRANRALAKSNQQTYVEVMVRAVKVTDGPGTAYKRIAVIKKGERLRKIAASTSWYQIELAGGKAGWVNRKYVKEVRN
ncbi:SH3 domain-containing protein [candidate division KSB1 bacterium]|nr:SH3 domain-containing protein [candidate division KSB1 bacterium]